MFKKILALAVIFYILAVLEASFFIFFSIKGITFSFILFFVILINIFEIPEGKIGIWSAFLGGFFSDVWSSQLFGLKVFIFISIAVLIKLFVKRYVQIPKLRYH